MKGVITVLLVAFLIDSGCAKGEKIPEIGQDLMAITNDSVVTSDPKGATIAMGKVYVFIGVDDLDKQMFQVIDEKCIIVANRLDFRIATPQEAQADLEKKWAASYEKMFRQFPAMRDKNSKLYQTAKKLTEKAKSPDDPMHGDLYDVDAPFIFAQAASDELEILRIASATPTPKPEKEWIITHRVNLPDGSYLQRGTEVSFAKFSYENGIMGVRVRVGWNPFTVFVPRWGVAPLHSPAGRASIGGGAPTPKFNFN